MHTINIEMDDSMSEFKFEIPHDFVEGDFSIYDLVGSVMWEEGGRLGDDFPPLDQIKEWMERFPEKLNVIQREYDRRLLIDR